MIVAGFGGFVRSGAHREGSGRSIRGASYDHRLMEVQRSESPRIEAGGDERIGGSLESLCLEASQCERCPLAGSRTNVVFGTGNTDADLMFVGEAPGFHEDRQGKPFVGRAGKLLDRLLGEIDMTRQDVFIANVLKCRPPGNRDPRREEIAACQSWLMRQIDLIEPRLVCTLGNFATKLLTGNDDGITRVHGKPQTHELAGRDVVLYPLLHPAAALYTPAMLELLRTDLARVPRLLARPGDVEPSGGGASIDSSDAPVLALASCGESPQLGLF